MNKQDTAQQLRKVANFLKGLTQAADDIEAIGSMEGATREAQEARVKAVAERDQALTELADAKAEGNAAVADAKEKAEKLLADAQLLAGETTAKTLAEAGAYATQITKDAAEQVSLSLVRGNVEIDQVRQDVADLTGQRAAMTAEVANLEAKRTAAQAELDKLTRALDKIKAQFKIEA